MSIRRVGDWVPLGKRRGHGRRVSDRVPRSTCGKGRGRRYWGEDSLVQLKRKVGLVALGTPCQYERGHGRDVVGIFFAGRRNWRCSSGVVRCIVSLRVDGVLRRVRRRRRATLITPQAPDPGRDGRGRQAVLGLWQRGQVPRAVRGPDGRAARR